LQSHWGATDPKTKLKKNVNKDDRAHERIRVHEKEKGDGDLM
jgi:hypothetical protein